MIYIIDGTGPLSTGEYEIEMAGSHCSVIHHLNRDQSSYERGPSGLDFWHNTFEIAEKVFANVMRKEFPPAILAPGVRQSPLTPIVLVGYSRGGAAALIVANMLREKNVDISSMFIFDAVERTRKSKFNLDVVPNNVKQFFHAIRNDGAEVVMEFEERRLWKRVEASPNFNQVHSEYSRRGSGSFENFLKVNAPRYPGLNNAVVEWSKKAISLSNLKLAMRNSFTVASGLSVPFGNCATKHPGIPGEIKSFAGPHSALGGALFRTLGEDVTKIEEDVSRQVRTWMAGKMHACGIRFGRR